uniref:Uncharacterized protein n=1 Tax=Culex tarsalis TaxID=7177 RepID=A0A1Q3FC87_CULTA
MLRRKHNLNCIVEDCETKAYSSRSVFAFPRCPERSKLWKQALGIHPEAEILSGEGVCSLHFSVELMKKDEGDPRNTWLLPGAIPGADRASSASANPVHCRMCGALQETIPNRKVSDLRRDTQLLPVLDICLDLTGEINSLLPDGVCEACTSMVRYISKYAQSCWKAQEELAKTYAPGKDAKVEPWKRLTYSQEETHENDPLQLTEDIPETKPVVNEEPSESEMIELIPMEEVKQEPQSELNATEYSQQPTFEPEETPQPEPEPPTPSNSKSRKRSAEPPVKRSRPAGGTPGDMYDCDFCAQKFAIKKQLDQHIRDHIRNLAEMEKKRQLQVSQFRCLSCKAEFPTADQLKTHFTAYHQKKIECQKCNMTFNFKNLLEKHNVQVHPKRKKKSAQ